MISLMLFFVRFAKKPVVSLFVSSRPLHTLYLVGTYAAAVLPVTAPSSFTGDIRDIALLLYAGVVTPIFGELIFAAMFGTS